MHSRVGIGKPSFIEASIEKSGRGWAQSPPLGERGLLTLGERDMGLQPIEVNGNIPRVRLARAA